MQYLSFIILSLCTRKDSRNKEHKCLGNPLAAAARTMLFQPHRKVLCVKVSSLIFSSSISHLLCLSIGSHTLYLLHYSASGGSGSNNPITDSAVVPSSSNISMIQRHNEQASSAWPRLFYQPFSHSIDKEMKAAGHCVSL